MSIENFTDKATNTKTLDQASPLYFKAGYSYGHCANSREQAIKLRMEGIKKAYKEAPLEVMRKNLKKDYQKLKRELKQLQAGE